MLAPTSHPFREVEALVAIHIAHAEAMRETLPRAWRNIVPLEFRPDSSGSNPRSL
jgi:hypothetical protein